MTGEEYATRSAMDWIEKEIAKGSVLAEEYRVRRISKVGYTRKGMIAERKPFITIYRVLLDEQTVLMVHPETGRRLITYNGYDRGPKLDRWLESTIQLA